jgi:integrase
MAHATREICGQVFDYGIACGYCTANPARAIKGALKVHVSKSMAAVPEAKLPKLLTAIDGYREVAVRIGLKLALLTFVRTQELTRAE